MPLRREAKASCQIRINFRHFQSLWKSVTDESCGCEEELNFKKLKICEWQMRFMNSCIVGKFRVLKSASLKFLRTVNRAMHFQYSALIFLRLIRNWIAFKVKNRCPYYPFCPSLTTRSSSPSLVLIHFMPCSCGSIISGHLSQFVRMVAFSVLIRSLGRFSFCHVATVALSVNRVSGSRFSVILIGTLCRMINKFSNLKFL